MIPPVMDALIHQLNAQRNRLESEVVSVGSDIYGSVEKTSLTVLIVSLHAKEDLLEVLNVLSRVESRIKSGLLRAIVLNGMNHPQVIALLKAKGITEIVDFDVSIKTLNHKIKNALLLVTQTFQRLQNQNLRASTVIGNEAKNVKNVRRTQQESAASNEISWVKPNEHPCDIWWIPSARNLRSVMGRWMLDLLGPGPAAGYWEETTYERSGEKGWEWKIRVSTDTTFLPCPGRWIFFGKQPEFVWQKNIWSFVSKFPYLAFYAEGQSDPEFVRVDSPALGKLKVIENSEVARQFLPKIQSSLELSLKTTRPDTGGVEKQSGSFDLPFENANVSKSGSYNQGDLSRDDPEGSWNQHGSSVGVDFGKKDKRIDESKAKPKWRSALSPDSVAGGKIGLEEVEQKGITTGAKTFQKLFLQVTLRKRNGQDVAVQQAIRVIELTQARATFEFPLEWIVEKDNFTLLVEFRLGDVEKKFELDWNSQSTQIVEGAGCLAEGEFTGGELTELAQIIQLTDKRQVELRDFFVVAKGA